MCLTYPMSVKGTANGSPCILFSTRAEGEGLLVIIPIYSLCLRKTVVVFS